MCKIGVHLPSFGKYAVGVVFFPKKLRLREECREIFNSSAEKLGLEILAWRKIPVEGEDIGVTALSVEPVMEQVFIACPDHIKITMTLRENYLCCEIMQRTQLLIL